ncbi:lipoprotein [Salmonella enterica subsp. enterica serovar Newport str. VA_R100512570]|nr:lipoprotein [Salmonella enterica subsp. enterica serovar Newport str. VA_R100512570]
MKLPYAITLLLCLFLAACTLPDRFSAVAFQQLTLLQTRSTRFLQDAARIPWQKETLLKDDRDIRQTFFRLSGSPVKVGINTDSIIWRC